MREGMRVVIIASGGHTGYAVALAQRLHRKAELLFIVPCGDSWTRSRVERFGRVVEVSMFLLVLVVIIVFLLRLSRD